jgi:hypothetical protein
MFVGRVGNNDHGRQEKGSAISVAQAPSMREVMNALEWVRREMMRKGSPDFIRERQCEDRVQELVARLLRGRSAATDR